MLIRRSDYDSEQKKRGITFFSERIFNELPKNVSRIIISEKLIVGMELTPEKECEEHATWDLDNLRE